MTISMSVPFNKKNIVFKKMKKIIKDIFLYSSFHAVYVSSIYLYYKNNLLFYDKGDSSKDVHKPVSSC